MKTPTVPGSENGPGKSLRPAKRPLSLDRGVLVDRLGPIADDTRAESLRRLGLKGEGMIRTPQRPESVLGKLKTTPAPRLKGRASAVAALLADRREGR